MSSGAIHAAVGDAVANALTPTNPACSDGAGTPPEPNTAQDPLPSELPKHHYPPAPMTHPPARHRLLESTAEHPDQ